MCRQLTIITESLPVRETFYCRCGKRFKAKRGIQTEATLPKREILCLTRAASLQNRLEKKELNKKLQREQRRAEKIKQSRCGNKKRFDGNVREKF